MQLKHYYLIVYIIADFHKNYNSGIRIFSNFELSIGEQ